MQTRMKHGLRSAYGGAGAAEKGGGGGGGGGACDSSPRGSPGHRHHRQQASVVVVAHENKKSHHHPSVQFLDEETSSIATAEGTTDNKTMIPSILPDTGDDDQEEEEREAKGSGTRQEEEEEEQREQFRGNYEEEPTAAADDDDADAVASDPLYADMPGVIPAWDPPKNGAWILSEPPAAQQVRLHYAFRAPPPPPMSPPPPPLDGEGGGRSSSHRAIKSVAFGSFPRGSNLVPGFDGKRVWIVSPAAAAAATTTAAAEGDDETTNNNNGGGEGGGGSVVLCGEIYQVRGHSVTAKVCELYSSEFIDPSAQIAASGGVGYADAVIWALTTAADDDDGTSDGRFSSDAAAKGDAAGDAVAADGVGGVDNDESSSKTAEEGGHRFRRKDLIAISSRNMKGRKFMRGVPFSSRMIADRSDGISACWLHVKGDGSRRGGRRPGLWYVTARFGTNSSSRCVVPDLSEDASIASAGRRGRGGVVLVTPKGGDPLSSSSSSSSRSSLSSSRSTFRRQHSGVNKEAAAATTTVMALVDDKGVRQTQDIIDVEFSTIRGIVDDGRETGAYIHYKNASRRRWTVGHAEAGRSTVTDLLDAAKDSILAGDGRGGVWVWKRVGGRRRRRQEQRPPERRLAFLSDEGEYTESVERFPMPASMVSS